MSSGAVAASRTFQAGIGCMVKVADYIMLRTAQFEGMAAESQPALPK